MMALRGCPCREKMGVLISVLGVRHSADLPWAWLGLVELNSHSWYEQRGRQGCLSVASRVQAPVSDPQPDRESGLKSSSGE